MITVTFSNDNLHGLFYQHRTYLISPFKKDEMAVVRNREAIKTHLSVGYFRKNYFLKCAYITLIPILLLMPSCNDNKKYKDPFIYQQFRDYLLIENRAVLYDSTNMFDSTLFIPGITMG